MNRDALNRLSKNELIDLVERQACRIEDLGKQVDGLEQRIDELTRQVHRAAAPFGRPDSKRNSAPKRPGRKGGHQGCSRARPTDEKIDQHIEVPLDTCPHCGDRLATNGARAIEQTIVEIPPLTPKLVRLVTWRKRCNGCGQKVASSHPLQVSTAVGAAGVQLGPRALGIAASLNKGLGLTMRKTCRVLHDLLGLQLTPGGLSQALARIGRRLELNYQDLLQSVKSQDVIYTDETSWWVGEASYSLWVLTNDAGTCYRVVSSRSKAAAADLIDPAYQGVLVSDCLNIYDNLTAHQHKCYAHHLKAIAEALARPTARGSPYLHNMRALLKGAIALKEVQSDLPEANFRQMRVALEESATRLLSASRLVATDGEVPDDAQARCEEGIRLRLAKQRDHLFTFLDHEVVEATNNRAERQLRPAVITRKLSCGNKTETGARTWQILASLAATCHQAGTSFIEYVAPKMTVIATDALPR